MGKTFILIKENTNAGVEYFARLMVDNTVITTLPRPLGRFRDEEHLVELLGPVDVVAGQTQNG